MKQLWIVQPYLPAYREPFFLQLRAALLTHDLELRIAAGEATGAQAARQDSVELPWVTKVRNRTVRLGSRRLTLSSSRKYWLNPKSVGVIVPHMGSSLDANLALMSRRQLRVGVWGHIDGYTSAINAIDGYVEAWQLRRAHHVFAYTEGGGEFARRLGVPSRRLSVVMNTIDSDALAQTTNSLLPSDIGDFRLRHNVPPGPYLAYLGGLDADKKIDLLAAALQILFDAGKSVHVVVAGTGDQVGLLGPAVARRQVTLVGRVGLEEKAVLLAGSSAIVNPGRVGLLAVDALVSRRAVFTTEWEYHAPEIEYLVPGQSVFFCSPDESDFADSMLSALATPPLDATNSLYPTLAGMVNRFSSGIFRMLDSA